MLSFLGLLINNMLNVKKEKLNNKMEAQCEVRFSQGHTEVPTYLGPLFRK